MAAHRGARGRPHHRGPHHHGRRPTLFRGRQPEKPGRGGRPLFRYCDAPDHAAASAQSALREITGFGPNPTGLRMFLYVPQHLRPDPAIVVAMHYCGGSGPAFFGGTEFASLADEYGFIVIYPSVIRTSPLACFDVSTPGALTHDGDSDPVGIVSMVRWAQRSLHASRHQVFATGISSGAMMTDVLLGDYPNVFAAGSVMSGVPFGCFAAPASVLWNTACATGTVIKAPRQWGDLVRAAYPATGGRGHGSRSGTARPTRSSSTRTSARR